MLSTLNMLNRSLKIYLQLSSMQFSVHYIVQKQTKKN